MSIDLSAPGIAILIDNWEENIPSLDQTYKNIVEFIHNNNIQTVVLATYEYNIFTHFNTDWMNRSHQIFYDAVSDKNKNAWRTAVIDHSSISLRSPWATKNGNLLEDGRGRNTSDIILNMNYSGVKLFCHRAQEIVWYLDNHQPDVKNIWYFGQAWEMCVRDRALGYINLSTSLPHLSHLTKQDCVLKLNRTHPGHEHMEQWKQIHNDIYHLELNKNA